MSKVTRLKTVRDRNLRYKPWEPLLYYEVSDIERAEGIVAAFQNHIITVFMKTMETDSFSHQSLREDNRVAIYQLMCKWTDPNRGGDIDLKYLKRVRDEVCEPGCEAVYHFPADYREVQSRFTDIWVFEKGFMLPFGRIPSMSEMEERLYEKFGNPVEKLTKEDVEVFVVHYPENGESPEIREVFSTEEECKQSYGERDYHSGTECSVMMLGDVPPQSPACVWTKAALAKLNRVISLASNANPQPVKTDFFDDHVNNEDIDDENDMLDAGPRSDEENLVMTNAMKAGMDAKAEARVAALRQSVEDVISKADDNIDHAMNAVKKL